MTKNESTQPTDARPFSIDGAPFPIEGTLTPVVGDSYRGVRREPDGRFGRVPVTDAGSETATDES